MTHRYVYSGAAGTADGSSWANAFTTLVAALTVAVGGDFVWVADDHAETSAATQTVASAGTAASPVIIICARRVGGSVPPVAADLRTTGTVTVTASAIINFNGYAYCYGLIFNSSGAGSIQYCTVANFGWIFENGLHKLGSSSSQRFNFGATGIFNMSKLILKNTSLQFGQASQGIVLRGCDWDWIGGGLAGATVPTTLFLNTDTSSVIGLMRNVDLSLMGSGKTIFGAFTSAQRIVMERPKLGGSVTVAAGQVMPGTIIDMIIGDSGNTNYRSERYTMQGVETTETTVIMSGGASDGTTPFSHKIVTGANDNPYWPFESMVLAQDWVDTAGSAVSQTFELLTDNLTLTNTDAWVEVEYLGTSGTPLGVLSTSFAGLLVSGSNLTTSAATWTTTGLTTPTKQKITFSFTPQAKGIYRAVLKVARPSTTLWVNPPAQRAA